MPGSQLSRRRTPLAWLALLLAAVELPHCARACTSLLVGADASDDGSSYIARNVDHDWNNVSHSLRFVPPRREPFYFHANLNAFRTTLPAKGLAYWSVPAEGSNTFESSGVNSVGVAISATETIYMNAGIEEVDPLLKREGITEDSIPSVLLPQARTAKQAIQVRGEQGEDVCGGGGGGMCGGGSCRRRQSCLPSFLPCPLLPCRSWAP
jgi:dipeptidase